MKKFRIIANIGGIKCYWGERDSKRASLWYTFPTVAHTSECFQFLQTIARTRLPADINYVNGELSRYVPVCLLVEEVLNPITSDNLLLGYKDEMVN